MKSESLKQFFVTYRKTMLPLGWVFGLLASVAIVLSIYFAIKTQDWVYATIGMIGAAQLSLAAGMIMLSKAAGKAILENTDE